MNLPEQKVGYYKQTLWGSYGEFGAGDNRSVFYVQASLRADQVKHIDLVSQIPDSDKWEIRDLFQRDVDFNRVENKIVSYLKDASKIKFFSSLILTFLPMEGRSVISDLPDLEMSKWTPEGATSEVTGYDYEPFYRIGELLADVPENNLGIGAVSWNPSRTKLVAIDGQHRLAALKMLAKVNGDNIDDWDNWRIPVVIFGLRTMKEGKGSEKILDSVRKVFTYINTTAKIPSKTRSILLNDEDITAICTQEVIQYAHGNDSLEEKQRIRSRVPLLFYDWKGDQKFKAYLKSAEEIHDTLEHFLLKSNKEPQEQVKRLCIGSHEDLYKYFLQGNTAPKIAIEDADKIRARFRYAILPLYSEIVENFTPWQNYISELRDLESSCDTPSQKLAFDVIRFGDQAWDQNSVGYKERAENEYKIEEKIADAKSKIGTTYTRDIFWRGVFWAASELIEVYENEVESQPEPPNDAIETWSTEYGKWFVSYLNKIYEKDYFNDKTKLRYLCYGQDDNVINYKWEAIGSGAGPFLAYVVVCMYMKDTANWKSPTKEKREEFLETMKSKYSSSSLAHEKRKLKADESTKDLPPSEISDRAKKARDKAVDGWEKKMKKEFEKSFGD